MTFRSVASLQHLWSGELARVELEGVPLLLVNIDGAVLACVDACPHMGMPLSTGSLQGSTLTCSTHRWQFDARTGEGVNPRSACLSTLPVKIEGDDILVDLEEVKGARRGGRRTL